MTAAAFLGDYCDLRFVKSRKIAQISIEIPIERAAEFVAAFGTPNPASGVPVAIARIDPTKAASDPQKRTEPTKERRRWDSLPPAQQSAIRCSEQSFQRYVAEEHGGYGDEESTIEFVRSYCGVKSRSEIKTGTPSAQKWELIDNSFLAWLHT